MARRYSSESSGDDDVVVRSRRDKYGGHSSHRDSRSYSHRRRGRGDDESEKTQRHRRHHYSRHDSGDEDDREERKRDRKRGDDDDDKPRRHRDEDVKEDSKPHGKPKSQSNLSIDPSNLGKSGGVYIPPFKLARMMKEVEDKSSVEYQRLTWDALRKSINGLVNKVNATNIKNIIPELFSENLIRGRGLFCRSCMKSQMASPGFTDVFAALVAVVNTKFREVGDLLLRRIVLQLKRAYKRNDKVHLGKYKYLFT